MHPKQQECRFAAHPLGTFLIKVLNGTKDSFMTSFSAKAVVHFGVHWLRLHFNSFKYKSEFAAAPGVYYGYSWRNGPSIGLLLALDALVVKTSKRLNCRDSISRLMGRINGHNIGLDCFRNNRQNAEDMKVDCEDMLQRVSRRISPINLTFIANDLAGTYWKCENCIIFGLTFSVKIVHLQVIDGEMWVKGDIISGYCAYGTSKCDAENLLVQFVLNEQT